MADEIKKINQAPEFVADKGLTYLGRLGRSLVRLSPFRKAGTYWHKLGPGLTTGAADDDPSGIATYSQTGASYGFGLLWLAAYTFPLMAVVQEMCARIGLVTGIGLAANIRKHFPRPVLYGCTILLLAANIFNIGADLGAMAKATQLLLPHARFGILIALFAMGSLMLQIFLPYKQYAKYLKFLAIILLSYVFTGFIIHLNWHEVIKGAVLPHLKFDKAQILLITGILGTTISPYLFFWQTSQEVEEEILAGKTNLKLRQNANAKEVQDMRLDVWTGMFISNLVMFFIIAVCAATLHAAGITTINSAADAAAALKPLAGPYAAWLFTLGIIGTGMLAVPVLAGSASYALSEALGWKQGLYRKLHQAYGFYGVIIISMLIGLSLNFIHLDPIKALIYSAVLNGLVSPVILIIIVIISSNKKIMGEWVNGPVTKTIGWIVTALMVVTAIATIVSFVL